MVCGLTCDNGNPYDGYINPYAHPHMGIQSESWRLWHIDTHLAVQGNRLRLRKPIQFVITTRLHPILDLQRTDLHLPDVHNHHSTSSLTARTSHCRCWPSSCAIRSSWSKRIFSYAPEWFDFGIKNVQSQMLQNYIFWIQICNVYGPHGLLPHAMALAASWVVPNCHLPPYAPNKDHAKSCRDSRSIQG